MVTERCVVETLVEKELERALGRRVVVKTWHENDGAGYLHAYVPGYGGAHASVRKPAKTRVDSIVWAKNQLLRELRKRVSG